MAGSCKNIMQREKAGVKIIVLGRQKEESGYTYEEIIDLLKEEYHFKTMQK